jgi:hypothetical protein
VSSKGHIGSNPILSATTKIEMHFTIDEKFFSSVCMRKEHINPDSELEMVYRLKYGPMTSTWFEDHPEFLKLRDKLEAEGFIKTQRSWSNGDTVVKPFTLNGQKFKKGDRFLCAPAMKHHITSKFKR